jgi:hypothetical protein
MIPRLLILDRVGILLRLLILPPKLQVSATFLGPPKDRFSQSVSSLVLVREFLPPFQFFDSDHSSSYDIFSYFCAHLSKCSTIPHLVTSLIPLLLTVGTAE